MNENEEQLPIQTIEVKIDPWQDRREPFVKMCRELAAQADRFTNGADPEIDRSAAVRSLGAVTQFMLDAVPSATQLGKPLFQLAFALADLDEGGRPPMLERSRISSRPKRPKANEMRYAVASAYITLEVEQGCSLTEASRAAQSLFEKYAVPLPGKTATALEFWRDRLLQRTDNDPVKDVYLSVLACARESAKDSGGNPTNFVWSVLHDEISKPAFSKIEF